MELLGIQTIWCITYERYYEESGHMAFPGVQFRGNFSLGCTSKPEFVERKCSNCNKTAGIYGKKRTVTEGNRVIHGMRVRGVKVILVQESNPGGIGQGLRKMMHIVLGINL